MFSATYIGQRVQKY